MKNPEPASACERHATQLIADCEGSLPSEEALSLQRHRENCPDCRAEFTLASIVEHAGKRARYADPPLSKDEPSPQADFGARVLAAWRSELRERSSAPPPLAPCTDLLPAITAWLEGDLEAAEVQPLRRHLDACVACREYVVEARMTDAVLAKWDGGEPSPALADRVLADLENEVAARARPAPAPRSRGGWLGQRRALVAAAALLVTTLTLRFTFLSSDDRSSDRQSSPTLRPVTVRVAMESLARQRDLLLRAEADEMQPHGIGSGGGVEFVRARGAFSARRNGNLWHRSVQNALLKEAQGFAR